MVARCKLGLLAVRCRCVRPRGGATLDRRWKRPPTIDRTERQGCHAHAGTRDSATAIAKFPNQEGGQSGVLRMTVTETYVLVDL